MNLGCLYLTAGCEINFAQLPTTFGARRNRNPDADLARPYQIVYNAGVTHELRPGVGVAFNYYRREFHDVTYTTNLANPVSAYTPYDIRDPRGTGTLTVYNADPAKIALVNELDTTSTSNKTTFDGFDLGVNVRLGRGVTLAGGSATGRTVTAQCDLSDPNYLSATAPGVQSCDQGTYGMPWLTTVKFSGSAPVGYGFRVSGVLQSSPGDQVIYTYVVTAANFRTQTGVPLTQSSVTARLTQPGTEYPDAGQPVRHDDLPQLCVRQGARRARGQPVQPVQRQPRVEPEHRVSEHRSAAANPGRPADSVPGPGALLRLAQDWWLKLDVASGPFHVASGPFHVASGL